MQKENYDLFIYERAFNFAKRIIKLYKYLCENKKEFILSKQLLRSGTSIGANIKEARYAESNADFIHKLHISLKEASESEYWLELLKEEYLTMEEADSLLVDLRVLLKLLISGIKKKKEDNLSNK